MKQRNTGATRYATWMQTGLETARRYRLQLVMLVLTPVVNTNVEAMGFLSLGAAWQEEVQLADGRSVLVERSQSYRPNLRIESFGRPMVTSEVWTFSGANGGREVTWRTEFGLDPGKSSLNLLVLAVADGAPHIATSPADCISFNKWERPNPPYVFMKFDGQKWQRIPLSAFPANANEANVLVGLPAEKYRKGTIWAAAIKQHNRGLPSYLRVLVRETIAFGEGNLSKTCPEMIHDGKGGWQSPYGYKAPHPIPPSKE